MEGLIPPGTASADSISLIKNYISSWVEQQLFLDQAEKKLTNAEMDFSKQIEDFKNSLSIYAFEKKILNEKLDTTVTDKQIEEYYSNHQDNFELRSNIVKVNFVKLMLNSPAKTKSKNFCCKAKQNHKRLMPINFLRKTR